MILAGIAALLFARQAPFPMDVAKGIIEDFESGSFANWKITGSFGRANLPTNAAEFNLRYKSTPIANFEGKFFALSLDRSNAETGKAVSPSFEIPKDWSQISFDILGGNDPAKTAFRLLRDDSSAIVRSASGDGTLNFARKSWNVADLRGKSVHLEIEDSATGMYGFIGLDNIRIISALDILKQDPNSYNSNLPQVVIPSQSGGLTYKFALQSEPYRSINQFNFGLPEVQFNALTNLVLAQIYSSKFDATTELTAETLGHKLRACVDSVIDNSGSNVTKLGRQWLIAEATSGWIASRVAYDQTLNQLSHDEMIRKNEPSTVLASTHPRAVCNGFTRTTKLVADFAGGDLGLKCDYVGGYYRNFGQNVSDQSNHAWNVYTFDGGIRYPADATMSLDDVNNLFWATRPKFKLGWTSILPRNAATLDFFFARHYAKDEVGTRYGSKQNIHQLTTMSFDDWSKQETTFMSGILKKYAHSLGSY